VRPPSARNRRGNGAPNLRRPQISTTTLEASALCLRISVPPDATTPRDRPVEDPADPLHVAPLELRALCLSGVPIGAPWSGLPDAQLCGLPVAAHVTQAADAASHGRRSSVGWPCGGPDQRATRSRFADTIPGCPWEIRTGVRRSPGPVPLSSRLSSLRQCRRQPRSLD